MWHSYDEIKAENRQHGWIPPAQWMQSSSCPICRASDHHTGWRWYRFCSPSMLPHQHYKQYIPVHTSEILLEFGIQRAWIATWGRTSVTFSSYMLLVGVTQRHSCMRLTKAQASRNSHQSALLSKFSGVLCILYERCYCFGSNIISILDIWISSRLTV